MDDRTFYDIMSAYADPYHVSSTVGGAMVQEGLRAPRYGSSWPTGPRSEGWGITEVTTHAVDSIEPFPASRGTPEGSRRTSGQGSGAIVGLTTWLVRVLWPLNAMERLGRRITRVTWRGRLPLAALAALVAPGVIGSGGIAVLLGGAIAGWFLLPVVGTLIALVAILTGLTLALGIIGVVLVLGFNVLRAIVG